MQPIKTCTVSRCRSSSTRNLVGIVQWQKRGFRVLHEQRINQCTLTLEFLVMGHFVWEALGSSRQQQHALAIEFLFKMDNQRPNRLLYIYSLRHFWGNDASFTMSVEMDSSNIQLSICYQQTQTLLFPQLEVTSKNVACQKLNGTLELPHIKFF